MAFATWATATTLIVRVVGVITTLIEFEDENLQESQNKSNQREDSEYSTDGGKAITSVFLEILENIAAIADEKLTNLIQNQDFGRIIQEP